jgi:uncharacterized protein YdiU (UPF0061 family)
MVNPWLTLPYERAIAQLGTDFYDVVTAAQFPMHRLRWRNDELLGVLGLAPEAVGDDDFIEAFGLFRGEQPFLALRYHGYQFGHYNPQLGDGRGFLYGQVRGTDGHLYDLGTKGSGRTPYSRTADGRLTLKGGVREVLAAEVLHRMGVRTSRCLSLVETGEELWRGDEPSPTRSAVMVRMQRSHIRFGTFERLHFLGRADLVRQLLDHVIETYYGHLSAAGDRDVQFYAQLVQRVAELTAQWMAAGFCHGVLNTDNMAITGESFDYGPYAFLPTYDPRFTAAYFDYQGRYCYHNQPNACYWNLEMLHYPLKMVMDGADLAAGLGQFAGHYHQAYETRMAARLGFAISDGVDIKPLVHKTLQLLQHVPIGYNEFFAHLRLGHHPSQGQTFDLPAQQTCSDAQQNLWQQWRALYQYHWDLQSPERTAELLRQSNPLTVLVRPEIERVWEAIATEDDWQPFYDLAKKLQTS